MVAEVDDAIAEVFHGRKCTFKNTALSRFDPEKCNLSEIN